MQRWVEVRGSAGWTWHEEGRTGVAKIERRESGVEVRWEDGSWRFYPWSAVSAMGASPRESGSDA